MRFNLNEFSMPIYGDRRTVVKFALFPVIIDNVLVWLEKYKSEQVYNTWKEWTEIKKELYDNSPH